MHTPEEPQFSKDERIVELLQEWLETMPERQAAYELARANFEMECG
jgi:hypothetical protein